MYSIIIKSEIVSTLTWVRRVFWHNNAIVAISVPCGLTDSPHIRNLICNRSPNPNLNYLDYSGNDIQKWMESNYKVNIFGLL
jgi:hypothetical protein